MRRDKGIATTWLSVSSSPNSIFSTQNVYADLAVEAEASTVLAMHLAQAFDAAHHGNAQARAYSRLATAIAKFYVCKRAPGVVYEAMECFGGYVGWPHKTVAWHYAALSLILLFSPLRLQQRLRRGLGDAEAIPAGECR